jgi:hypothetical protein
MDEWRSMAVGYEDQQVLDFLEYGFPASYGGPIPDSTLTNHASARQHPSHIAKYVEKEVAHGAMLGPHSAPLFTPWSQVNPLLTRPKKDTTDRRVIVDLSFPHEPLYSVNGSTPADEYLQVPLKLKLPSAQDLAQLIKEGGRGCLLYSIDISRAYRQLALNPTDTCLTGIKTDQGYFTDLAIPFGLRWGAMACQRVTNVVAHIVKNKGAQVVNYIDDFGGMAVDSITAHRHFQLLTQTLQQLGLDQAKEKAVAPTDDLVWLGVRFSTRDMTMSIPPEKLKETMVLVQDWLGRSAATLTQLRSVLGKLLHIAQCSDPARLFLNRMLATLRACPSKGYIQLSTEFKKDLHWFQRFLPATNGVYIIREQLTTPRVIKVDSCMTGCGGVFEDQAYHALFPQAAVQGYSICHMECLNCLVALRSWAQSLRGATVHLRCDSATAVATLQHGRGRDCTLQAIAREIWLLAASHDMHLEVTHIAGEQLTDSADALSRWHTAPRFEAKAREYLHEHGAHLIEIPEEAFFIDSDL